MPITEYHVRKFFVQPTRYDGYGSDCINFNTDQDARERKLAYDRKWLESAYDFPEQLWWMRQL